MSKKCKIDDLDLMSLVVAGGCHDFEHPGFNNVYLVEVRDQIAIRYNGKFEYLTCLDVSVLENHHIAASFLAMQEPGHNILE